MMNLELLFQAAKNSGIPNDQLQLMLQAVKLFESLQAEQRALRDRNHFRGVAADLYIRLVESELRRGGEFNADACAREALEATKVFFDVEAGPSVDDPRCIED